ncbi:unnamed protein product [Bemisia tabaci]|uniref:ADF-H domain-containing protein n=1 Tax=Bemisia tabaci TaxID=7038 RepID=A0A9P0CDC6_BEMTA|nr:PREDICTED: glia maturation factor beta [Bemisia tabaci]CAH0771163.1 unnamed protein product [Bemisia tabaci]
MSQSVQVCDIEDDVRDAIKKFRFRKSELNSALILKVNREQQRICVDDLIEDVSLDDLQEILPGHQPRFVVYSYKMEHSDGRISYPMCFIYITPRDSQMELQVMYAGTKMALQRETNLTRVYEVRELEELTEEWLKEKLQ